MVIDRGDVDPGALGDVANGHAIQSLLAEKFFRGVKNARLCIVQRITHTSKDSNSRLKRRRRQASMCRRGRLKSEKGAPMRWWGRPTRNQPPCACTAS